MAIRDSLLPEFDHEMAQTRLCLERLPDAAFAWGPHPKSMTLGKLANHIAEVPGWVGVTMGATEFDMAPPGAPSYVPKVAANRAEILAVFDAGVAAARPHLAAASDADFMTPWSLKKGGVALMTMPRIACIRTWVLNHLIHHRGQLTVYLRLTGASVPAVYGPSADEGQM